MHRTQSVYKTMFCLDPPGKSSRRITFSTIAVCDTEMCGFSLQPASEKVGRVRRFFDISVPRNVAADVSDLEGARVFNVDDLKEVSSAL